MTKPPLQRRYFTSYTGVALPLKLVNELEDDGIDTRITYFIGYYDTNERLSIIEKMVYGEIEFSHHYEYHNNDTLEKAIIINADELPRTLLFNTQGQAIEA